MKKILFTVLIFCLPFSGKCQAYQSLFGQDSTAWMILEEVLDGALTTKYQTIAGFDSTFNGQNYKKVFNTYQSFGLIREDTVDGKAWYYSFISQSENLFMDLSLNLNDSFMIYTSWMDSIPVIVDSVYYKNGLKHVRLDYLVYGNVSKLEFIEGTGTNAGITYQRETHGFGYISEQLLCKYTDSAKVYVNVDFNGQCSVYLVGVNEYLNDASSVAFPNPVNRNELLTIRNDIDPVQSVHVLDLMGNSISRQNSFQIEMTQPAGIYFIEIIRRSGKMETLKICVVN